MENRNFTKVLIWGLSINIVVLLYSCKKFLDDKPDVKLTLVEKASDLQKLMDQYYNLNVQYPSLSEVQSDNYSLTETSLNSLNNDVYKDIYTWTKTDLLQTSGGIFEYLRTFESILIANVVISEAKDLSPSIEDREMYNNALGSAYFFRAYYYQALAQLFTKPYNNNTSNSDLGLPLRDDPDFSTRSIRSTIEETYQFIISDLKMAKQLLAVKPLIQSRPSKIAAYGSLARLYLYKNEFANAKLFADSCLTLHSELIDFNTIDKTSLVPFDRFNKEVIFNCTSAQFVAGPLFSTNALIDPILYNLYTEFDLRKKVFYHNNGDNTYSFKGDYDGNGLNHFGAIFGGIAVDELYLIRAEAKARTADIAGAMQDLNKLLETRYETGKFVPLIANTEEQALKLIIQERRKELVYRGARWSDIRRLTGPYQIIPKRVLGDKTYTLEPGSLRYTLAFPREAIERSGMQQNP